MKKNGFTLAEVLMTMTIIGVIASMTLPTLTLNTRRAQIGPKLATAVSNFEQANQALLNDYQVDSLSDTGLLESENFNYATELVKYLKGSADTSDTRKHSITTNNRIRYALYPMVGIDSANEDEQPVPAHMQRISLEGNPPGILIDFANDNNASGNYWFSLWNDGSLRPMGSTGWDGTPESVSGGTRHWSHENNCPNDQTPKNPNYCAGSIFENNLRVRYRM